MVAWSLPLGAVGRSPPSTPRPSDRSRAPPAAPCRPDVAGSVMVGLLFASAACGFILPGLAPWLAGSFLVTEVVAERLLRTSLPSPAWMYVVDLGLRRPVSGYRGRGPRAAADAPGRRLAGRRAP